MGYVLGIDEVGRGAWAGPLVIGAVILGEPIPGLKDSKMLTARRRQKFAQEILEKAVFAGLGWAEPKEIDDYGLSTAHMLACMRAVRNAPRCSQIIIDGNINYLPGYENAICKVKADQTVPQVSAASIVAKVARDKYMSEQALIHKNYGFDRHVGYGTKLHIESLKKQGLCVLHRKSYKPIVCYGVV
ncbi:MAG: ribonuclease HII [Candidatus Saccharimonadales bacterium]